MTMHAMRNEEMISEVILQQKDQKHFSLGSWGPPVQHIPSQLVSGELVHPKAHKMHKKYFLKTNFSKMLVLSILISKAFFEHVQTVFYACSKNIANIF